VAWCKERGAKGLGGRVMRLSTDGNALQRDDDRVIRQKQSSLKEMLLGSSLLERRLLKWKTMEANRLMRLGKITVNMSSRRTTDGRDIFKAKGTEKPRYFPSEYQSLNALTSACHALPECCTTSLTMPEPKIKRGPFQAMQEEHWASAFRLDGLGNYVRLRVLLTTDSVSTELPLQAASQPP
jgi:hypothetical protein